MYLYGNYFSFVFYVFRKILASSTDIVVILFIFFGLWPVNVYFGLDWFIYDSKVYDFHL